MDPKQRSIAPNSRASHSKPPFYAVPKRKQVIPVETYRTSQPTQKAV